jgi:uncharacterized membrane protein
MKNGRWGAALAGIYGAGALTMYFLDPQRGKRRRAELKDALVHSGHRVQKFADRFGRDFTHRFEGTVAEAKSLFREERVPDEILEQRVRSALGRTVSHPHAIDVKCKDGSVTLSGWILADELQDLEKAVQAVKGTQELATLLHATDQPEHISELQGGTKRKYVAQLLQESWSPTTRVIGGGAGLGLIAYGLSQRESLGVAVGLGGAGLLLRSITNAPLRRVAGVGRPIALQIQKTMRIAASPSDLYEFWVNPENYPRVFTHVKAVTREGEGTYRWHLLGPAGAPLTWTGTIVRRLPGKTVEWQSLPGSVIENHGIIRLDEEEDGRTRVHIRMSYTPPAGLLGHTFAALLGVDPKSLMDQDFVQLKAVFEQGITRVRGHEVMAPELKAVRPPAS